MLQVCLVAKLPWASESFVLNGGYRAWRDAGYPIDSNQMNYMPTEYHIDLNEHVFASFRKVKDYTMNRPDDIVLMDSRESKRYEGIEEPIDKKPAIYLVQ